MKEGALPSSLPPPRTFPALAPGGVIGGGKEKTSKGRHLLKEGALPPSLPPPRTLPSTGSGFCRRVLKTIGQGACAGEGPIRGRPDFCVYEGVSVIRFCFPAAWRCPDVFAVFGFFGFGLTVPGRKAELCCLPFGHMPLSRMGISPQPPGCAPIPYLYRSKSGRLRGKFPGERGSERGPAFQGGPSLRGLSFPPPRFSITPRRFA